MLNLLVSVFSTKYGRIIGLVFLVGSLIFFLLGIRYRPANGGERMPVVSLLQNIKFMQELDLVKYYYEEIIVIGDPLRLERMANQAASDTIEARNQMELLEITYAVADSNLFAVRQKLLRIDTAHQRLSNQVDSAHIAFQELPRKYKSLYKVLNVTAARATRIRVYGEAINSQYEALKQVERKKPRRRSGERRKDFKQREREWETEHDAAENALEAAFQKQKDKRRDVWQTLKDRLSDQRSRDKKVRKALEKELKQAEKQFKRAQEDFIEAQSSLNSLRLHAVEARKASDLAIQKAEDDWALKNPRLLAVVPANLGGYIDLSKVEYPDESEIVGDTITIHADSILLSRVYVNLDSTSHFDISKKIPKVKSSEEGLFFEVFQQLRQAVDETERRVLEKALRRGIISETCDMACKYFDELMSIFGYKARVIFKDSRCDCAKADLSELGRAEEADLNGLESEASTDSAETSGPAGDAELSETGGGEG